ncbi:MAG TPA: hypothetical protein VGZ00_13290 [Candidatus Baltobacteraceae bacterium]|jgi:hypothetical protein|nr:hypothetical protein [Candidatus Baltobacteraceae bacterium]
MSKDSRKKSSDLEHALKVWVGIAAIAIFPAGCASSSSTTNTKEDAPPKLSEAVAIGDFAAEAIAKTKRFRINHSADLVIDDNNDAVAMIESKYRNGSMDVTVSPISIIGSTDADAFAEVSVVRDKYPTATVTLDSTEIYDKSTPAAHEVLRAAAKDMHVAIENKGTKRPF